MISNIEYTIKLNDRVRVEKLDEVKSSSHGIHLDYWLEGILQNDIQVGGSVFVLRNRNSRNPDNHKNLGIFTTSMINEIESQPDRLLVKTDNSTYSITKI